MLCMKDFKLNTKAARGIKAALGVVLVLSFILTLFFIAFEAHHECEGEECPICICLDECVNTVKGFCNSLPILSAVLAAFTAVVLCSFAAAEGLVFNTPISIKVRMNN